MLKVQQIATTCTGCGACTSICPKQCVSMEEDKDGFYYPRVDSERCIECHSCEKVCHIVTPLISKPIERENFFIYKQSNEEIRQASTSGGAFSLFANYVLEKGGVVFGSAYNGPNERLEVISSDICGLEPLRKSKYIESFLGQTFKAICHELNRGRWVLYCGTPCQAAGLRKYVSVVKVPQDKLIIIDFACHGVPSNAFFRNFKRRFENKNRKVIDAEFRVKDPSDPKTGWHIQTLRLTFNNGNKKVIRRNSHYFYYYTPFDISVSLRRSCYNCDQVGRSQADVTIGDFWDIKDYDVVNDDNKGYSFIKIHNEIFLPLLKKISKGDFLQAVPNDLIKDPYKRRSKIPIIPERDRFLILTRKYPYYKAVRKYFGLSHILKSIYISQLKDLLRPTYNLIWKRK